MDLIETDIHAFVIRIWLEEMADGRQNATWRGQITHVPSGRRRSIDHLHDIATFIEPYLEAMGIHQQKP